MNGEDKNTETGETDFEHNPNSFGLLGPVICGQTYLF